MAGPDVPMTHALREPTTLLTLGSESIATSQLNSFLQARRCCSAVSHAACDSPFYHDGWSHPFFGASEGLCDYAEACAIL